MSHLTAPPTPFSFPREPIPSNKTQAERGYQPTLGTTLASTIEGAINEDMLQPTHSEIHLLAQNRKPSLSYQNSGFRDSSSRPVHRSYRYFVVVVPPPRLVQEHGHLGHTLSFGPPHRLSQGIIMPLFPTMYGQLNAIAKEFNFPSTKGLCLYLQLNEGGIAMTPRISEESWHMLWNNLFETPSVGRVPPIGGRIEFDIDFGQARWYSSWLSTTSQDHIEHSGSSVFHTYRGSVGESEFRGLDNINSHLSQPRSTSISIRHVPRKLSLVDRFDIANGGQALSDPEQSKAPSKALSPIAQQEEPKSARHQLDDRVRSWRASAIMATTSPASSHVGLEPMDLLDYVAPGDSPPTNPELELNIEDFTWSISSLGPGDYDLVSVDNSSYCLPSPDIADRMLDDSPPTPSTATTWGPPSYCPSGTLDRFESLSLDLGIRNTFSRPLTPTTMTSWGPVSPAVSAFDWYSEVIRPRSVHLCERGEFSRPVTPSTATSWGAPLSYPPTPITPYHVSTPDAAQLAFDHAKETSTLVSRSRPVENTWNFVWPYLKVADISAVKVTGYPEFSIYPPVYPHFDLYPTATASTYANQQNDAARSQPGTIFVAASQFPQFDLYPSIALHSSLYATCELSQLGEEGNTTQYGAYPNLTIYPAVYPCFDLYPGKAAETRRNKLEANINLPGLYPCIHIYSPAYPNFNLYPPPVTSKGDTDSGITFSSSSASEIITEVHRYPIIRPYASVYPYLEPYPPVMEFESNELFVKRFALLPGGTGYPSFNLYPPLAGSDEVLSLPQYSYPFLQIYQTHPSHATTHNYVMEPRDTQILPRSLTGVAATPITKVNGTRRRKSHKELHEEVFRSNLVRGPGETDSEAHGESVRRPQYALRDNRRITMTRSPTGPAFHRLAVPPALPHMISKASTSSTYDNADSHPTKIFHGTTVHEMTISSARHRSPAISSPPRIRVAAAQRVSVAPLRSTNSKQHHGSDVGVDVPCIALTGLSRPDPTGNGTKLLSGSQYGDPYTA